MQASTITTEGITNVKKEHLLQLQPLHRILNASMILKCSFVRIIKCHGGQSTQHLAVSSEQLSFKEKNNFTFTMSLYCSPCDHVIHVALIATPRTSLITSSQPPLEGYILFIFDR